ncbi:hypothetical protein EsHS_00006333 [Epichloe bromicola]
MKTKRDLDWGSVIHLQDSFITLEIPASQQRQERRADGVAGGQPSLRGSIAIFGQSMDALGTGSRPSNTNQAGFNIGRMPSPHWTRISRMLLSPMARRPFTSTDATSTVPGVRVTWWRRFAASALVVFGRIHASYGREDVTLDIGFERAKDRHRQ